MKRLLKQLDSIEAIVDTVSPSQIEDDPQGVASCYELYASSYDPLERVKTLRDNLITGIHKGKPVNGYLSADYGYGKTATLVYLWYECQQQQIVAVPPFKFKELGNLMVASYWWIKASLKLKQPELISEIEELYRKYGLQSQQEQAAEIARKYRVSVEKALKIVQELKTETTNTDSILQFWQYSIPILRKAGMKGLAIFADESQEFLRTEEGASVRIQILSDLIKGMRALGNTPVALILGMPTVPTESAIEEQAGDIIHRMQEQKVSLRLADAYNSRFPAQLWNFLCTKFLDDKSQASQLASSAMIESLGQLCERKDLSNGPRTIIEVFKRIVKFFQDNKQPYTPLHLIDDYLQGRVELYGTQERKINDAINTLESLISFPEHPKGREAIKLLASFPSGISKAVAEEFELLETLEKLAEDENFYSYIIQPTEHSFAIRSLLQTTPPTIIDKILNQFRQKWLGDWSDEHKQEITTNIFRTEIISLLYNKTNWSWRYKDEWKEDRFGFHNFLNGAPERYSTEFPQRALVISVANNKSDLMKFHSPEVTHLDWRFYLNYNTTTVPQRITAIAGTGQVDFDIELGRSFEDQYPTLLNFLTKVVPPEQCSACTLLTLSHYIQTWLFTHPEVSKAERASLEHHRQQCHHYAIRLLFPAVEHKTWKIEGLEHINGAEIKLIESVFYQKCKALFPKYKTFYNNLRPALQKYKCALEKVPLVVRRGRQVYEIPKTELEDLFEVSGSSLDSILKICRQHGLISEFKIAGNKEEKSYIKFSEHSLELFINQQLSAKVKRQPVTTKTEERSLQGLSYLDLEKKVKQLGYLQEEFAEAVEWLELRRYVKLDRQKKVIYKALGDLEPDELKWQLNELRTQISSLITAFNEPLLSEIKNSIHEAASLLENNEITQLNIFNESETELNKKELYELTLYKVNKIIQENSGNLEIFIKEKQSIIQKDLSKIKHGLENLSRQLNNSKVSQLIVGNSELETCLNEYRKDLEKQVNQLYKDCQHSANSITLAQSDVLVLHNQLQQYKQFLENCQSNKNRLEDLVFGLENWRIILTEATTVRESVANNQVLIRRYNDEFLDRVVEHFDIHKIESFRDYDLLKLPLLEIKAQVDSGRRSRRETFERSLNQYQALLSQITSADSYLRSRCKYDDEDREGSYEALRQLFLEKLFQECENHISDWEQLERELYFIARNREQNVTKLLNEVSNLKTQLLSKKELCKEAIADLVNLEVQVKELKYIFENCLEFREETRKLQERKDENILEEEKQLLSVVSTVESGLTISQACQSLPDKDVWELLKALYKKGYLEITLRHRN
ncbi:MAG TPA: hypothetical protein V6D15_18415 [Oculatellaceae cyanobacterium]|jgi:hypothetical protein